MNVNFQKIISSFLLSMFLHINLTCAFSVVPALHDDVLRFREDEGINRIISSRLASCGNIHALALFKVAADALSGEGDAQAAIKIYFNKDNIIEDLTRIVQAVRLGRGYRDGLRTDMYVPTNVMDGYRVSLNTIGGFISKDSEPANLDHIHTTQKGANFTEHLRLTNECLHRSANPQHPIFNFTSAAIATPPQPQKRVMLIPASEDSAKTSFLISTELASQTVKTAVVSAKIPDTLVEETAVAVQQSVQLQIVRHTAAQYAAMEAELISKRNKASEEFFECFEIAREKAKKVRALEKKLENPRKEISKITQRLEYQRARLKDFWIMGTKTPNMRDQVEKTQRELDAAKAVTKDEEADLVLAFKEHFLADEQETAARKALKLIDMQLSDLREAAEQDAIIQIKKRVMDLNLESMPLIKVRRALELIDRCRTTRPATYEEISDTPTMVQEVFTLLEKHSSGYAIRNIEEILSDLFAQSYFDHVQIVGGIRRLNSLPRKLLNVRGLGRFFMHIKGKLKLEDSYLLHLISHLFRIPAEFAENIIEEYSTKLFAYDTRGIDYRIDTAMHSVVTGILETTKKEEFQEFLGTLDTWNMREQKAELQQLLSHSNHASVRCEDALRWLKQWLQEGCLASFVDYFKGKMESERLTLKPLTGANSSFLHSLARTFYMHESVQFTKEMALAMRSMDFDTYPWEDSFGAFREVYLKLIGRAYFPQYLISQGPRLLKQLYAASNKFSNCEEMLRLLNRYEDLVLADVEVEVPGKNRTMPSGLVPTLLVKSRVMMMDSLCKIGERNVQLITFANDTLCQDFFDAEDLVNCGSVDSETLPYRSCYNSPLGYGRASCNAWHRVQVMEAVARNVESLKNPNRQQLIQYFVLNGNTGDKRAWIIDAFCQVPDSVVNSPDFQRLCQHISELKDRTKIMGAYEEGKGLIFNLPFIFSEGRLSSLDLPDCQKAIVIRDLINMADSADPSYRMGPQTKKELESDKGEPANAIPFRTEFSRNLDDDPSFADSSDKDLSNKKMQLYAYLFHAANIRWETLSTVKHEVSGRTITIRPVPHVPHFGPKIPLITLNDDKNSIIDDFGIIYSGQEIVDELENVIAYIPDPMYAAQVAAHEKWIKQGRVIEEARLTAHAAMVAVQ